MEQHANRNEHAPRYGPGIVLAVIGLLAAFVGSVYLFSGSAGAQEGGAEFSVIDVGGGGEEFMLSVHTGDGAEELAQVSFTAQGSAPVSLEPGTYLVMPVGDADFGYRGWGVAQDGECPIVPTAGGGSIEVELMSGNSTLLCIYHEAGASDVSDLDGGASDTPDDGADDGDADDGASEDAQQEATPEAPSTGTGTARTGSSGEAAWPFILAGLTVALGSLVALSLQRRVQR